MREAETVCFGQAALDPGDPSDLAREAHFADRHEVLGQGVSVAAEARARAIARSAAGSESFTPPTVAE